MRSCHARRHNDLEGHRNFSSTIYSFSVLCLEHHYCGVHLQVKSDKCLCTSGGVLGLENLVLFTSLITAVGSMSNIIDVAVALDLLTSYDPVAAIIIAPYPASTRLTASDARALRQLQLNDSNTIRFDTII